MIAYTAVERLVITAVVTLAAIAALVLVALGKGWL